MSTITITEVPRANIRAQRARLGLTQASVAKRMNQLGFGWYPQTCGLVERNQRPLEAAELAALALALETTPAMLALPPPDVPSVMFGEQEIPAQRLSVNDGSVAWDGDDLSVTPSRMQYYPPELHAGRPPWWPEEPGTAPRRPGTKGRKRSR